jgi:hypothetical protein
MGILWKCSFYKGCGARKTGKTRQNAVFLQMMKTKELRIPSKPKRKTPAGSWRYKIVDEVLPKGEYITILYFVKEKGTACQTSFKMSPVLPRLKCPLGDGNIVGERRGCRW